MYSFMQIWLKCHAQAWMPGAEKGTCELLLPL